MPIFDQGYQHWNGTLSGHGWRWLVITRRGVQTQVRPLIVKLFLLSAWAPALLLMVFLALWGLLEQRTEVFKGFFGQFIPLPSWLISDPTTYRRPVWTLAFSSFLYIETVAAMVLVMLVGPNLISQDLRFNAMPLYQSRPLTRLDYFLGKLGTIGVFLGAIMIIPAIACYVIGLAFSLNVAVLADTIRILPACLAYGAIVVLVCGLIMLALSSLNKTSRYGASTWIGLWLLGYISSSILANSGLKWGNTVSFFQDLSRVREALLGSGAAFETLTDASAKFSAGFRDLFQRRPKVYNWFEFDYPWQWSACVLAGLVGLSIWILSTRVKSLDRLK